MIVRVKTLRAYREFIAGRDVDAALHREDNSPGEVIGWIDDATLRDGDVQIEESEFDSLAGVISEYNSTLPIPPPIITVREQAKLDYAVAATVEARVDALAKYMGFI